MLWFLSEVNVLLNVVLLFVNKLLGFSVFVMFLSLVWLFEINEYVGESGVYGMFI